MSVRAALDVVPRPLTCVCYLPLTACAGAAAKSYLAEVTPPQTRGRYLGILNSFFYVGQITATGMMIGTQKMTGENSWRLPLYIQVSRSAFLAK